MNGFVTQLLLGSALAGHGRDVREWAGNYAHGRLVGLAATFGATPFLMLSPANLRDGLPVLAAALSANLLGFLALRRAAGPVRVLLLATLGMAMLAIGIVTGLAPPVLALAAAALAIDALAAPGDRRLPYAAAALAGALAAAMVLFAPISASAAQTVLAVALLPVAALTTLNRQMTALRAGAAADSSRADAAISREHLMLAAADAAVLIAERSGHVVDVTDSAARLLGASSAAICGRGLVDRVLIADRPALLKAISDAAIDGSASELTVRLATALAGTAPEFAHFALDIRPAAGANGRVALRLAPAVALVAAPRPSADRGALFAALSHEVRTPMNAILGFSELLANPALTPRDPAKVGEYAAIIQSSARESFAVTSALVDLLRVETTPFSANETVDAEEMIRAGLNDVAGRAATGTLQVAVRGTLSPVVADQRALRMLISALVEGLTVACGPQASIECTLGETGLRPSLDMMVVPAGTARGHARPAFLGVLRELCRRLADVLGAGLTIEPYGAGWRVALTFALPGVVTALNPAPRAIPSPVESLRKSA